MNKTEKMRGCVALCVVALNNLKEIKETLITELNALFLALGIKDKDAEKIEDAELYKIALDLDYNAQEDESIGEDLANVIKYLEKLSI